MSFIFWVLVTVCLAFGLALAYRIGKGARTYNLNKDNPNIHRDIDAPENGGGEFDLFLLRWTCTLIVITFVWSIIEGAMRLLN